MDGVRNLNFAKDKLRQAISAHEAAKSRLDAADNRGQRADRGAYEAKRDVRDARQRGEVVTRFMAAVRRTDLEAKREGHVTRRIQDEARRKGEELRLAEDDLKRWSAEVDRRVASASRQRARLKELAMLLETARSREVEADEAGPDRLGLTARALTALEDLLARTPHDSDQALRLTVELAGGPTLAVDTIKEEDYVVTQDDQPVLLIENPTPDGLQGITLDIDEQGDQPGFVLRSTKGSEDVEPVAETNG